MRIIYLIACITFFLAFSCKKEPEQNRDNHSWLECKINGKHWEPGTDDWMATVLSAHIRTDGGLSIRAKNHMTDDIFIGVYDSTATVHVGEYILDAWHKGVYDKTAFDPDDFVTDSTHTGKLVISTLDTRTSNRRIKGTFYYTAFNYATGETVNVTEGAFNIFF